MIAEYKGNDRSVVIDADSALWLARMLVGEGYTGDKGAAVLWSTLYRYLGMPHKWPSYKRCCQLFSTPINDRWIPGGDLYEKYKTSNKPVYKQATSKKAVEKRLKIRSMEWDDMPQPVIDTVDAFSKGTLPPPNQFEGKKISNFASWKGVQEKYPNGIDIGGDWFFVDPNLKTGWQLQIIDSSKTDDEPEQKDPKTGFTLGVLLLMAAFWLMKKG
jgi:hypothetical protein